MSLIKFISGQRATPFVITMLYLTALHPFLELFSSLCKASITHIQFRRYFPNNVLRIESMAGHFVTEVLTTQVVLYQFCIVIIGTG